MGWFQALRQGNQVWGGFRISEIRRQGIGSQSQGSRAWDEFRISEAKRQGMGLVQDLRAKEAGRRMGSGSQARRQGVG